MEQKVQKVRGNAGVLPQNTFSCSCVSRCGGCSLISMRYEEQLQRKNEICQRYLGQFGQVSPIIGMEDPLYYRHKVHHAFARDRKGRIISGSYQIGTRHVIEAQHCLLEDRDAQEIMQTIRQLITSFKLTVFDDRTHTGLIRHVLIRKAHQTGQIMVIIVTTIPAFPSKHNFVKALLAAHPQITTIVQNINGKATGMVLGDRSLVMYGKGSIEERLLGFRFTMDPTAFFQINPVQTEKLYQTAVKFAGISGTQAVVDAYCGTGTIGLLCAPSAREVIGVELNAEAVKNAAANARTNQITNARFHQGDAGEFLHRMADEGQHADVVMMDPPRSGSSMEFLKALLHLLPERIVYVSCNPETLARDLEMLKNAYRIERIQPYDMFPMTEHVETVVLMSRVSK